MSQPQLIHVAEDDEPGGGRLDRIAEAMRLGASGYLMKPFEPDDLLDRVRAVLG